MEEIVIRGKHVKVDIEGELRAYDWGARAKFTSDKLIAPSPFRQDGHPSFFVNLTGEYAGTWKDSGWVDPYYASGGFIKLLAFLRNESYEETEDYLLYTYGVEYVYDKLDLGTPGLTLDIKRKPLPSNYLKPYKYRSPYLAERGISEKVQRMARIGYDMESKAIVIPWVNQYGEIANCKFRSVRSKVFWYAKDAVPIKHLVYGIDVVYGAKASKAVICEAEIDALTWDTLGTPGIAVGGVHFTNKQADIIRRSPIKELLICADNDEQGAKLRQAIIDKLAGHKELIDVKLPAGYKDINEVHLAGKTANIQYTQILPIKYLKL